MFKRSHPRFLLTAFVLTSFLLGALFDSEGALLCFGKDGHVAIEFVDACSSSDFGSQAAGSEKDDCGSCIDVQFFSSPATIINVRLHEQPLSPHAMSAPASCLPLKESSGDIVTLLEYSHHKTIASIHSVVLLI